MKTIIVNTTFLSVIGKILMELSSDSLVFCPPLPHIIFITGFISYLIHENLQEAVQSTTRSLTQVNEDTSPFHVYFILF